MSIECLAKVFDTGYRCLATINIGGLRGPDQIIKSDISDISKHPNTLSPNTLFVKYGYMPYTPNRSVCQGLFVYRPKRAGEGRDTLISKHYSKHTIQTLYRGYA